MFEARGTLDLAPSDDEMDSGSLRRHVEAAARKLGEYSSNPPRASSATPFSSRWSKSLASILKKPSIRRRGIGIDQYLAPSVAYHSRGALYVPKMTPPAICGCPVVMKRRSDKLVPPSVRVSLPLGAVMAVEALNIMKQRKITSLAVVEGTPPRVAGVVHLHDLWRTEMI